MATATPYRTTGSDGWDYGDSRSPTSRRRSAEHAPSAEPNLDALPAPGVLRSETFLTLQTRQAQRLLQGRRSDDGTPVIVGLTRFATLLRPIWNGARADDPYADWWMVRVHDAIEESERELGALMLHIEHLLQRYANISFSIAQSVEPIRVPLSFSNPYAFRGTYLLSQYDDVIRGILTTRHVALLDQDRSETLLSDAGRHVRRAYLSALGYRFLGINRDDLRLLTARAKQAEVEMGALPEAILNGQLRAPHAPERGRSSSERGQRFALRSAAVRRSPAASPSAAETVTVTEPIIEPSDGATRDEAP